MRLSLPIAIAAASLAHAADILTLPQALAIALDSNRAYRVSVLQARTAADAVGLRLAGIDLITPDLGASLTDSGGSVIEVNSGPGLHHHYHVADAGRATRVAVPVLSPRTTWSR